MKQCPAIIAALPRELSGLVRGWERRELAGKIFVYTNDVAVAACAGMGAARVALAVEAARAARPVTALISAGLAGACDSTLTVGDLVHAGEVINSRTGERFTNSQFTQVLGHNSCDCECERKDAASRFVWGSRGGYGSCDGGAHRARAQPVLPGNQGHLQMKRISSWKGCSNFLLRTASFEKRPSQCIQPCDRRRGARWRRSQKTVVGH